MSHGAGNYCCLFFTFLLKILGALTCTGEGHTPRSIKTVYRGYYSMTTEKLQAAASLMKKSKYTVVFTGAGISVESGVPSFRGPQGLWKEYDPLCLNIRYFRKNPEKSWPLIKKIFYDIIGNAKPNAAHYAVAALEKYGYIRSVITQNIDNLHQHAGSKTVYEYHGTIKTLSCIECWMKFPLESINLEHFLPSCPHCAGLLKPDFVFFGEPIPEDVNWLALGEAQYASVMLIVGTTGTVKPASLIPYTAKRSQASIIEVNVTESLYTRQITDIFLRGRASDILPKLADRVIDNKG